jgi:hypothetical protein
MAEWSSSTITCVPEGEQRVALASEISKVSKEQHEHVKPLHRLGQLPPAPSPRSLIHAARRGKSSNAYRPTNILKRKQYGNGDDDSPGAGARSSSADTSQDQERRYPTPGNWTNIGFDW